MKTFTALGSLGLLGLLLTGCSANYLLGHGYDTGGAAGASAGSSGISGISGVSGAAGSLGSSGHAGTSAQAGVSGSSTASAGASGSSGTSASSGAGASGSSGTSASSGVGASGDAGAGGATCGNGVLETGETCDDHNQTPGDGCSASCRQEVAAISANGTFACAVSSRGVTKCWGQQEGYGFGPSGVAAPDGEIGNDPGEVGSGIPIVNLGSSYVPRGVTTGNLFTCVAGASALKCWGQNELGLGALGLGDSQSRGFTPDDMGDNLPLLDVGGFSNQVLAGNRHACAWLGGGSLKCWGDNTYGQLGLGDKLARGNQAGQMGTALPAVEVGGGHLVKDLAVGFDFSCAELETGAVKCWGRNEAGELGQGDTAARGDAPGEMGDALPSVDLGNHLVKSIAAGGANVCVILDDDSLKCWGDNHFGQLGLGDTANRGDQPGQLGDQLPALDLGSGHHAIQVSVGRGMSCAVLENHSLKCWGSNAAGALGLGDMNERGSAPGQMGDNLPALELGTGRSALAVSAGSAGACAILDDRTLKCWGQNGLRTLGVHGDQPGEMGDNLPVMDIGF